MGEYIKKIEELNKNIKIEIENITSLNNLNELNNHQTLLQEKLRQEEEKEKDNK